MTKPIREMMNERLTETGMSLAELARRSGVSYHALRKLRLRDGASTSAENARKIIAVLEADNADLAAPDMEHPALPLASAHTTLTPSAPRFQIEGSLVRIEATLDREGVERLRGQIDQLLALMTP